MKDNREFIRVSMAKQLNVYDAQSDKLLGRIVDISTGGFKMVTNSEMEQDREYLLNIILPQQNSGVKSIDVKANVKWCSSEADPELTAAGCYLVEIDALGRLDFASLMLNNSLR